MVAVTPNQSSPLANFIAQVRESIDAGNFVGLLLSAPSTPGQSVERIIGRLVEIQGRPMISLTHREARRDTTCNLGREELLEWLVEQLPGNYRSAVLETTGKQWQLAAGRNGTMRLAVHRASVRQTPSRSHDRAKHSVLDESAKPWLKALSIIDEQGRIRASMGDKHRQLERYLEIMSHLIRDVGWKAGDTVTLADMGCGKGYLTFGVWHLLSKTFAINATVVGVETREDLVAKSAAVARSISADSLHFIKGTIVEVQLPALDGLIALHACNTATDDAIQRGIAARARLIVVSPCCHQEVREQLGQPPLLAPLMKHGILEERLAEWLTDGLRALHLEQAGYATKVMEFVGSEHTPRNLLITGVRSDRRFANVEADRQIQALKDYFKLQHLAIDEPR